VLIQSLVIIAAMVVLSGAILTSTLVTAKASLHHTLLAKTQTAMNDATAAFIGAAASDVRKYGTEQPWPSPTPSSQAMCGNASSPAGASVPCPFLAVASWRVTGRTSAAPVSFPSPMAGSATSNAQNLAATIDEQRVSATIAVRITDPTGRTLLADRSREVTARIFNASPYVVITGSRDSTTAAGSVHAAEGDTGGTVPLLLVNGSRPLASPIPNHPERFIDTRIRTSVDCYNSQPNFDQANPHSAADVGLQVDHSIRSFGNQDWAYEAPCAPAYAIDESAAPSGYATPIGSVYLSDPAQRNHQWRKGDGNRTSFAR